MEERVNVLPAQNDDSSAPVGYIDFPPQDEPFQTSNAVRFEGWALDLDSRVRVELQREPRPGDASDSLNELGFVPLGASISCYGVRPDVSKQFPEYPFKHQAGWNLELRRNAISSNYSFRVYVHVIAYNSKNNLVDLGRREIVFAPSDAAPPFIFCDKPFNSVMIEANGDIVPYPDCRLPRAFGSILNQDTSFDDVWFGSDFTELRRSILNRDPPQMCLTCAHFINRNVNDSEYFDQR